MSKAKRTWTLAAAMAVGSLAGAAAAEDVYVNSAQAILRDGKGLAYNEVATVKKGGKLTVIERQGNWVKVRSGDNKEGWVSQSSLTANNPGGGMGDLSKLLGGGSSSSAASSAEAGKGLGEALEYAKGRKLSLAGLEKMKAIRKSVKGAELDAFMSEGKVGSDKQ